jgi:hypothetical protein
LSEIKNIVIVSNETWGDIWFSKHHYASELSRGNFRVFFVDPSPRWNFLNLFKTKIESYQVTENLFVLRYCNNFPSALLRINNYVVSKRLMRFLKRNSAVPDIFWTFDPMRLFNPDLLGAKLSLFHAVDKYYFTHPAEKLLHQNVDAFVCVSKDFETQYEIYGKPVTTVPHGISPDEFNVDEKEFEIGMSDFILYIGYIDLRLDFAFIARLLTDFPEEKFVFVGGIKNVDNTDFKKIVIDKKFDNILFIPPVHAKKLKFYIDKSKACLAPMMKDVAGNLISHHKILQYMAHGKPVFGPVFSEYGAIGDLLYMHDDPDELIKRFRYYLNHGENSDLISRRIELAHEHEYKFHIDNILDLMKKIPNAR